MDLAGLIEGIASSRNYFLRHLRDLPDEAWSYKPFPECKSILESLVHLRIDDEMALESIQTKEEPDYAAATVGAYEEIPKGQSYLLERLAQSHQNLIEKLKGTFEGAPLDAEICVWGSMKPLYRGVPYFSSEDFYHAGQLAFVRMAIQPDWDYYSAIYGD